MWRPLDSVASVGRIFTKLINRLEKIYAKHQKIHDQHQAIIEASQEAQSIARKEMSDALAMKAKLEHFLQ